MRLFDQLRLRSLSLFRARRTDRHLDEELSFHIEQQIAEYIAAGMTAEQARRLAAGAFGGVSQIKEECRDMRRVRFIENLAQDVRYGWRMLRKAPVFSIVAIATLALGVGANTAVFSVMNAAMLRLLPVKDPARLVYIGATSSGNQSGDGDTSITEYMYEELRAQRSVFANVLAYAPLNFGRVPVRFGADEPEEAYVDMVSGDFFTGLGVAIAAGRDITSHDETAHLPLAVLSYDYWQRRFAANPNVIGAVIYVKGVPLTVVGVSSKGFYGIEQGKPTDIWIPLTDRAELKPWGLAPNDNEDIYGHAQTFWCLKTIARLAPGIGEAQALAQAGPVFERAAWAGGTGPRPSDAPRRMLLLPGRGMEGLRERLGRPLEALMTMVVVVLAIACGNLALLLAARNSARIREFSLRLAVGGSRARITAQLLTESLMLIAAGAMLGWLFAARITTVLARWLGIGLSLEPDRTVLLFTLTLSIVVALVFGLAPLRLLGRIAPSQSLRTASASASTPGQRRRIHWIIAPQAALCIVLLIAAGLLTSSMRYLEKADLGFQSGALLVFGIHPPDSVHSDGDAVRFFESLLDRFRAIPGVQAATVTMERIGAGGSWNTGGILVDGVSPEPGHAGMRWNELGAGGLHVLGIPLLRGRDFEVSDTDAAPRVAIVDRAFAERFLAGRDPVGHRVRAGGNLGRQDYTIVGVAANSKYTDVRDTGKPTAYFPFMQIRGVSTMQVELRAAGDPLRLLPEVRRSAREVSPDLLPLEPKTHREVFESEPGFALGRMVARLAAFFGLLAVLLVATGMYGTLAYAVGRRTAEVGVRMALGARRGQVLWMILRQSVVAIGVGIAAGLPLALGASRLLRAMLFGISPSDVATYAGAVAGLIGVGLAASYLPARRASQVDPLTALRHD